MSVSADFKNVVASGNKRLIRIWLKNGMLADPTCEQFDEMEVYANSHIKDLYDEHDGALLKNDIADWTKDYMNELMVNVVSNFSRERVNLLKKVVQHQYTDRINSSKISKVEPAKKYRKTDEIHGRETFTNKQMAGAFTAVVGIGFIIKGICAAESAKLMIIGGVVLAVAGGFIVMNRGDD